VWRYAWSGIKATIAVPKPSPFTYVEKNYVGVFGLVLLVGFLPDAFFRHLLVPHAFAIPNAGADLLEIYTALWVCGAFGAMNAFPHALDETVFRVRLGTFAAVDVPRDAIAAATQVTEEPLRRVRRANRDAAVLHAPGTPLVKIELHREIEVTGYPFMRKRTRTLFVPSDRPAELAALLKGPLPASG
jgi:hypothetical protein